MLYFSALDWIWMFRYRLDILGQKGSQNKFVKKRVSVQKTKNRRIGMEKITR